MALMFLTIFTRCNITVEAIQAFTHDNGGQWIALADPYGEFVIDGYDHRLAIDSDCAPENIYLDSHDRDLISGVLNEPPQSAVYFYKVWGNPFRGHGLEIVANAVERWDGYMFDDGQPFWNLLRSYVKTARILPLRIQPTSDD